MGFTKLYFSGKITSNNIDVKEQEIETMPKTYKAEQLPYTGDGPKQTVNFPVEISEKMTATLQIQCPMDKKGLHDFLSAIEALKPGILQSVLDEDDKPN